MTRLLRAQAAGWEQIGITFQRPFHYLNVGFLAYDGAMTYDAVNQFFKLLRYREHAARFAHQLDASHGFESTQSATEEDRLITHQVLSDMIGVGWKRYAEWEVVDSEDDHPRRRIRRHTFSGNATRLCMTTPTPNCAASATSARSVGGLGGRLTFLRSARDIGKGRSTVQTGL